MYFAPHKCGTRDEYITWILKRIDNPKIECLPTLNTY